ncbi:MAG: type II secretion system protein [Verrucomicrobiota bacterium]
MNTPSKHITGEREIKTWRSGFTLTELMVTIVIVIVLASITVSLASMGQRAASRAEEIGAAKNLITTYQAVASGNNGRYLAGYDRTINEVEFSTGQVVGGPTANRYPYRLAAAADHPIESIALLGRNRQQIDVSNDYAVSLYPTFGINHYFVGGDIQKDGSVSFGSECARTISQSHGNVIAFASGGAQSAEDSTIEGYSLLTPPKLTGDMWSNDEWSMDSDPSDYGHLHPRHGNKVIAAFLDGSTRLYSIEELRDMRLWSSKAAIDNDSDRKLKRGGGGGRL